MTKKQLLKILNDDSLELTVEELENIIEEELQKDDSEMDPDLIEYCLYYISKAETDGGKEKKADSAGNDSNPGCYSGHCRRTWGCRFSRPYFPRSIAVD